MGRDCIVTMIPTILAINMERWNIQCAIIVVLRPLLLLAVNARTTTARSTFSQKPTIHTCEVIFRRTRILGRQVRARRRRTNPDRGLEG